MSWPPALDHLLLATAEAAGESGAELNKLLEQVPFHQLLAGVAVVFLATLVVSKISRKLRVPTVLGVLLLGVAINPDEVLFGPEAVEHLHIISLSMLLFYSGLGTNLKNIRHMISYGLLFTIGGVVLSSLLFGGIIFGAYSLVAALIPGPDSVALPFSICLLVAASLGCTDAGATLSVLHSVRCRVPQTVRHLLAFESSVSDPAAILFVALVIGILFHASGNSSIANDGMVEGVAGQLQVFIKSIGNGIMIGLILTYVGQFILKNFVVGSEQILIVGISIAMASYGLAASVAGSGFIAAYVTGLFLANNIYDNPLITPELLENSLEPFNTLMEILVFLLFGVLIDPQNIRLVLPEGLLAAAGLMLVARPLCVLLFSRLSPFNARENVLVAWCGLRGAVPLALTYAVIHTIHHDMPGLPEEAIKGYSNEVEGLIFLVVLVNLIVQSLTLPILSRRLGLRAEPEPQHQEA